MVRVLRCHHFKSQEVFTTDNEPHTMYTAADMVFVAMDQCFIAVHSLKEPGCPEIFRFPTIAPVKQVVYSEAEDFIATLEEKPSITGSQRWVRVYIHWRSDLSQQPMRVSIAGHMTSLRHNDEQSRRFEAIEIPLKANPKCICVDATFGNVGIGLGTSLLIYGFCTKTVAETKIRHRDIKCLLHLEFKFKIHQVALCEDYLACSSSRELQVVKLKNTICPGPDVGDCPGVSTNKRPGTPRVNQRQESSSGSLSLNKPSNFSDLPVFRSREPYPSSSTQQGKPTPTSLVIVEEATTTYKAGDNKECPDNPILDKREDKVDAPEGEKVSSIGPVPNVSGKSLKVFKRIMRKGRVTLQGRATTSEMLRDTGEILGPFDNPVDCPVSVEYEDVCNPDCSKRNHLLNGVATCLFRRFKSSSLPLHSLQLIPVYLHESHTHAQEQGKPCGMCCPISNHGSLVGMTAFISDQQTGYLYNVHGKVQPLAVYPYMDTAIHVTVGEKMLYAVTSGGLEVYTTRCLVAALHDISPVDNITNALPAANLEPCLVGIQPFIGVQSVTVTDDCVVLLSKYVSRTSKVEEANWSLYCLRCEPVVSLYHDMMELAEQHKETNPLSWLYLLQEGHMLVRVHQFKHGSNDPTIHGLICDSAALLAEYFIRPESEDSELALPYCLISGVGVGAMVRQALQYRDQTHTSILESSMPPGVTSQDEPPPLGRGLRLYLHYMLFQQESPIVISQAEGDMVLLVYAEVEPGQLPLVILNSTLTTYSHEKGLTLLREWLESADVNQENSKWVLGTLCVAVLLLRLDQKKEAAVVISSLKKKDVADTCTQYLWLLHDKLTRFTQLAQVLRHHERELFLQVLVTLVEHGSQSLADTMIMLQGREGTSESALHKNSDVREFLELVLADHSRKHLFTDAGWQLVDIYLCCLDNWKPLSNVPTASLTIQNIIPEGSGHFVQRFRWLNQLPPFRECLPSFKGPMPVLKPCMTSQAQEQAQLCLSTTENARAVLEQCPSRDHNHDNRVAADDCMCCHCNAELIKLQSLLCSAYMPHERVHLILSRLEQSPGLRGRDATLILCLSRVDPKGAVTMVTEQHTPLLPMFSAEMLGSDTALWSHVLNGILTKLKPTTSVPDDDKERRAHTELVDTFKCILAHTAEVLTPIDFITMLPPEGSTRFFLPFIDRGHRNHEARKLDEIIVDRN